MKIDFLIKIFPLIFFFPFLLFIVPFINKIKNRRLHFSINILAIFIALFYLSFVVTLNPIILISVFIFILLLVYNAIKGYFRN